LSGGPSRKSRTRTRRTGRIVTACVLIAVTSGSCTSPRVSPNRGRGATSLYSVSAVSGRNAWAVGRHGQDTSILHWDGTRWSRVTSPNLGSAFNDLHGVSIVSSTDVWAVGDASYDNNSLILHWDGTRWSRVTSPNPASDSNELSGVSATSATEAWAVGGEGTSFGPGYRPLILHWDGNTWSRVMSSNPSQGGEFLFDVSAQSAADAWAVGYDEIEGVHETLLLHWDGTGWSRVISPNPGSGWNELVGVSAVSPTDAWAVGNSNDLATPVNDTLILHWDGTRWSRVKSPSPGSDFNTLTGVSATSATDAWAVGIYRDQTGIGHTLILHWDGTRWSQVKSPNPGSEYGGLESVTAVSPKDAWAVGDYQDHALILHWDGTRWSQSGFHRDL
jgi:hypothetical protein